MKQTHIDSLLPVAIPPVIVQRISAESWAHFRGASGGVIGISPSSFQRFTLSSADPLRVVERERRLTFQYMGRKVKLGYEKRPGLAFVVNVQRRGILQHSGPNVFEPLACDVICQENLPKMRAISQAETRKKDVVHVNPSTRIVNHRWALEISKIQTVRLFVGHRRPGAA